MSSCKFVFMSEYLSNKFRWLSLIATWAVVCIHSRTDRWSVGADDYASRIEMHVADLFHFAVPLFFVISGYMFVLSYMKYGWGNLIKNKVKSLYLPMVTWGIIGLILCLPIRVYSHHDIPTLLDVCKLPLMVFRSEAVHFWYVRALLILFLVAPLAMFVANRIWLCVLVVVGVLFIPAGSVGDNLHIPVTVIFFLLGAAAAVNGCGTKVSRRSGMIAASSCLVGFVFSLALKAYMTQYYFSILFAPLFMIGLLWFGYDVMYEKLHIRKFPEGLTVLFFVYCMHLITLCWCGGIMRVVLGNRPEVRLCGYFALWSTFWVDVIIANLVRRFFPRIFAVLSGGR